MCVCCESSDAAIAHSSWTVAVLLAPPLPLLINPVPAPFQGYNREKEYIASQGTYAWVWTNELLCLQALMNNCSRYELLSDLRHTYTARLCVSMTNVQTYIHTHVCSFLPLPSPPRPSPPQDPSLAQ